MAWSKNIIIKTPIQVVWGKNAINKIRIQSQQVRGPTTENTQFREFSELRKYSVGHPMAGKMKDKQDPFMVKKPLDGIVSAANDPLLQRRILFHPARDKTVKGPEAFYMEPLNPQFDFVTPSSGIENPSVPEPATHKGEELQDDLLYSEPSEGFELRRIGAGLANLGNTCFLNSVLQCLTYTQPLVAYFQSGRHRAMCRVAGFCAMCALQDHIMIALDSSGKILSPTTLVRNLRCISRNFRISRQEDAHEYMMNLMEAMHKCCLPAGITSESPVAYEKSFVHKIFGGRLISQVKCTQCSHSSNKFDPFLDLSLQINRADSLVKALSHFTAVEQLDEGEKRYQCEQCKVKVRALKQLKIDKAPYILAIHLKRFSTGGSGGKIDKKIDFGCTLDLKPFASSTYEGDLKYTLYGVLVHAGWSTHSGHYFCFIRTSTGLWHALNDSRVHQISEKSVLDQKAYMLFYIRDKRTIIRPEVGPQFQVKDTKVCKAVSLNRGCPEERQLQDSYSNTVNRKSKPLKKMGDMANIDIILESAENSLNAGISSAEPAANQDVPLQLAFTADNDSLANHGRSNSCEADQQSGNSFVVDHKFGILKQGVKLKGKDTVDNGNGIQVVKHSRNCAFGNDNGHLAVKPSGVASRHQDVCQIGNDLTAKNGRFACGHLESGGLASDFMCNKHQEDQSGALLCKANGMESVKNNLDRASKLMKEPNLVCKQKHQKKLKDSNYLIRSKNLKFKKHLEWPWSLQTRLFTRHHLLLRAISILRKRSSYKKKCIRLQIKTAGGFSEKKHSVRSGNGKEPENTKRFRSSISYKRALLQYREMDLSNGRHCHSSGQHDTISGMTAGSAKNGGGRAITEQNGIHRLQKPRKKTNEQSLKSGKVIYSISNVEPSSRTIKESLVPPHSRNEVESLSVVSDLSKGKTSFPAQQLNRRSLDERESCYPENRRSKEIFDTSSQQSTIYGAAVPRWDGTRDFMAKIERARDKRTTNNIGYVLDEWDEEYDRGKRKKIKQLQFEYGTNDFNGKDSNGHSNPFQELANNKARSSIARKG